LLADLSHATELSADVCIVGGGPAGLTLARDLAGRGVSVILLEAGGLKPDARTQALYEGELADSRGHPWLHQFRVRALGGSSRIWGGRCLPFDPIDLEPRDWIPGSGWPIAHEDLAAYYPAAQALAEAGPFDYDPATALPGRPAAFAPGLETAAVTTRLERFSKPTDFWRRLGGELVASPRVRVLLNAAVTGVRLVADGGAVDHIEATDRPGARKRITAKHYVLAAGGLETVRLLLASNDVKPAGIGNDHDQLGRCYMSHTAATSGYVTFNSPPAFDYERDAEGVYVRRRMWITQAAQRELKLLNVAFRTHLPEIADPAHKDAILSAMYLVKDFVLYEYSRKMRERPMTLRGVLGHVRNIVTNPVRLARFSGKWVTRRVLAERKLPSVVLGSNRNRFALEFHGEQAPNPESRLTLSQERDRLGMPRLRADWRLTPLDTDSLVRAYGVLARALEETGAGRLDYDPDAVRAETIKAGAYGGHHLGGARMSADPARGVVDADCRVHGVDNLFVASSAVFPTSGQANPTLTILALTLRLADRLAGALAGGGPRA
jgi:choline dehydrogenase-like flavoprotein